MKQQAMNLVRSTMRHDWKRMPNLNKLKRSSSANQLNWYQEKKLNLIIDDYYYISEKMIYKHISTIKS